MDAGGAWLVARGGAVGRLVARGGAVGRRVPTVGTAGGSVVTKAALVYSSNGFNVGRKMEAAFTETGGSEEGAMSEDDGVKMVDN